MTIPNPSRIGDLRPDLRMIVNGPGQAYLLRTPGGVVLIDTGPVGTGDTVTDALRGWGLDRDALRAVILTHWHPDHAGSAAEIAAWPGVQVCAHHRDAPVIRGDRPGPPPILTPAEEDLYRLISAGGLPDAPPAPVAREVADDEALDDLGARIIATPGHTDGSIAVHFPALGALFTGDIAAERDGQITLGPFNVDRPEATRSFRRLAGLDVDVVAFGHGRPLLGTDTRGLDTVATAPQIPDPLRLT